MNCSEQICTLIEDEYRHYKNQKPLLVKKNQFQDLTSPKSSQPIKNLQKVQINSAQISQKKDNKLSFGQLTSNSRFSGDSTTQSKYTKILSLLKCENYQQGLTKIDRINKATDLLDNIQSMIKKSHPEKDQFDLVTSWRIIKQAVKNDQQQKSKGQRTNLQN